MYLLDEWSGNELLPMIKYIDNAKLPVCNGTNSSAALKMVNVHMVHGDACANHISIH